MLFQFYDYCISQPVIVSRDERRLGGVRACLVNRLVVSVVWLLYCPISHCFLGREKVWEKEWSEPAAMSTDPFVSCGAMKKNYAVTQSDGYWLLKPSTESIGSPK